MTENCGSCGAKPLPGSRFCWKCGGPITPREAPAEQAQSVRPESLAASACASCGAQLPAGARFCANCGKSVPTKHPPQPEQPSASEAPAASAATQGSPAPAASPSAPPSANVCPSCGAQLPADARFCAKCGSSVSVGQASAEMKETFLAESPPAARPSAELEETVVGEPLPADAAPPATPSRAPPSAAEPAAAGATGRTPPMTAPSPAPAPSPAADACPSCGAKLLPDSRFCNKCGHVVVKPSAVGAPAEATPKAALAEADDEVYEEETIELGRTAKQPRVRQPPAQPPVQPAVQAARRARAEFYERRTAALDLPFEQPKRWWLTALVALAIGLVAVGGAGAAVYFLGIGPFGGSKEATQNVELVVANTGFSPGEITVQPGRDVRLHLVNNDTVRHQFVLYRSGSDAPLVQGDVVEGHRDGSLTFSPPPSGRYVFLCALHPEMSGTFIVAGQQTTATPSPTASSTATPPASPTPTSVQLSVRYAIAAHIWPEPLNVRPDPSTKNKELLRLSEGERLEAISGPTYNDGRNWWEVRLPDGRQGYIAEQYIFLSHAAFGIARDDNNGVGILAIRDADILKDGSLLLSLAFTNVSGVTQPWKSDVGDSGIYLTDESGERYSSLEVGGAFGADLAQGLKPNETMTGWHRFSVPGLLDRLSTNTLDGLGTLTLHYPNHGPIEFRLQ
jgi:plastocyanin/predicted amidophosphoribosyltransferase